MLRALRDIGRNRRGAAAVEFALVAPVLISLYFGIAEYCQAMIANRNAGHVASTVGDLVAQNSQVSSADITDIFAVAPTLLAPFKPTTLKMRVTSVKIDANNKPVVDWSKAQGYPVLAQGAQVSGFPTNLGDANKPFLNQGEYAIMSEVQFTYNSPVSYLIKNGIVSTEVYYLRPRKSTSVVLVN